MSRPDTTTIAVFGGSGYQPGDPVFEDARALGETFARRGWAVANGGYGGIMRGVSQGARQAGGTVFGVTCSAFSATANPFVSDEVRTHSLYERLERLIELGDAYLVMPGSTGTLAELALVWEMVNKRMLPPRPILCWGDFWRPVVNVFSSDQTADPRLNTTGLPERRGGLITFAHTPDTAADTIARALAG